VCFAKASHGGHEFFAKRLLHCQTAKMFCA